VIGIFIVGCFITAIVATACGLVVYGIRVDQRDLAERKARSDAVSGTDLGATGRN
jgi:hypothetical protein